MRDFRSKRFAKWVTDHEFFEEFSVEEFEKAGGEDTNPWTSITRPCSAFRKAEKIIKRLGIKKAKGPKDQLAVLLSWRRRMEPGGTLRDSEFFSEIFPDTQECYELAWDGNEISLSIDDAAVYRKMPSYAFIYPV